MTVIASSARAYAPRGPVKLAQSTGRYAMITTRWVDRDGSSLTTVRTLATVGVPALAAPPNPTRPGIGNGTGAFSRPIRYHARYGIIPYPWGL